MKVFGIGLSRTGTSSLAEALSLLGYRTVHYPWRPGEIEGFDAAVDVPVYLWMESLDRRYPGSRFVWTVRDVDAWLDSCARQHGAAHDLDRYAPEVRRGLLAVRAQVYGAGRFDRDLWRAAWHRHAARVARHFRDRSGDLLRIDLCGGEGWERLCAFLGEPVPACAFPHLNRRAVDTGEHRFRISSAGRAGRGDPSRSSRAGPRIVPACPRSRCTRSGSRAR